MESTQEIIQGWNLPTDKIVVLARHESAIISMASRGQVLGYIYGSYDPLLSKKGIESARERTKKLPVAIRVKPDWRSGPSNRTMETALVFAGGDKELVVADSAFDIADYSRVSTPAIDKWLENEDDSILYEAWRDSGAHKECQTKAVARLGEIIREIRHIVGIVTHDEICRLIMCFFLGFAPEDFVKDECKVNRGEIVAMRVFPDGNVEIRKT